MISPNESIAIGLVDSGMVSGDFSFNLAKTIIELSSEQNIINSIFRVRGIFLSIQREKIITDWLNSRFTTDWILLLDSDILIEKEHIKTLIQYADKENFPIVTGLYFILKTIEEENKIKIITEPCIYKGNFLKNNYNIMPINLFPTNSFIPVDGAGLGITLIHKNVIKKIIEKNPKERLFKDYVEDKNQHIGEDLWFYDLVKRSGFQPYCHTGVNPKHLKTIGIDIEYIRNHSHDFSKNK